MKIEPVIRGLSTEEIKAILSDRPQSLPRIPEHVRRYLDMTPVLSPEEYNEWLERLYRGEHDD